MPGAGDEVKYFVMKYAEQVLRDKYKIKIDALEKHLKGVFQEPLQSALRIELAAEIAVILRNLFCYSGGRPLIKTAQMDKELLFPFYDHWAALNELSDIILVSNRTQDHHCTFESSLPFELDGTKVPSTWLTYQSWVNHIVFDLKMEGDPPLTRENVIKILADKDGAHTDESIDPFLSSLKTTYGTRFNMTIANDDCDVECSNLLSETVLSIAIEAVFAFKYHPKVWRYGHVQDRLLRVFDYSFDKYKRYKFMVCTPEVNQYSTNRLYDCQIKDYPIGMVDLQFIDRSFPVYVIDVENLDDSRGEKSR